MKENSREEDIEELKRLLYRDELTQYGKRKLINYYEQQEKDYKRVLKENELLRKDIEGWKKYCEEIEKDQSITSQLEQITTEKFKNGWFHQSEFKDSIPVEKIKDKIEKYKKLSDKFYVKFLESDRYNTDIREKGIKCDAIILALEELIEEREEE